MKNKLILTMVTAACSIVCLATSPANAQSTIFWEDFDGYSSFPNQVPAGDPVNLGIAKISEGADEVWYGGRFETPDGSGSIDSDLYVQSFGGGSNTTHVARFGDDAGLLFNISTIGLSDVRLSFDWRTFLADSGDYLTAGYFVGNLNFGPCLGGGEAGCYRDFLADDFGGNQTLAENWWTNSWTEIVRDRGNSWHQVTDVVLPENQNVWVAFWLDNGNSDYGKIDNIHVLATIVPEPISSLLFLGGGGALMARRRFLKETGLAA